jgi:very-short-patch-repair endonuclease
MSRTTISAKTRARARELRRTMTAEERIIWRACREFRQLGIARFRRQAPVGPYIVDFVDFGRRLIVEIDGSQHAESLSDRRRDIWLASRGFATLRFWNSDIRHNLPGVLDEIAGAAFARRPLAKERTA